VKTQQTRGARATAAGASPARRSTPATREDPTSSSIAGRRASGFLQVSLSKCLGIRPELRAKPLAPRHFR